VCPANASAAHHGRPSSATSNQIAWCDLGTGIVYAVEMRSSLAAGAWERMPPTNQWPVAVTSAWHEAAGAGGPGYYRVSAGFAP
jgi:hypothetical protein